MIELVKNRMKTMSQPSANQWKLSDAASYDALANQYGIHMDRLAATAVERLCLLAHLAPGQAVLDVGCGPGIATREAARRIAPGGRALGVDLSSGMVEAATTLAGANGVQNVEFRVMDAENLEFADRSFDAVVCLSAILHFPDIDRVLAEMYRVLRPTGRLVVSFGHVRPVRVLPLLMHFIQRALERVMAPVKPVLRAPDRLIKVVSEHIPAERHELHTQWSQGHAGHKLQKKVIAAGFRGVSRHWSGNDVAFDSAEAFWNAQVAISTEVRKRLESAEPELVEKLKSDYVGLARGILERGGSLRYAYGAQFVSGCRPG